MNHTDEDMKCMDACMEAPEVHRLIGGFEKTSKDTPHIQGAIVFRTVKSFDQVKVALGPRAHLAISRGDWRTNRQYCSKDCDVKWQRNIAGGQGERTDFTDAMVAVREGASTFDVGQAWPGVARCTGFIKALRTEYEDETAPEWRDVHVTVLWGSTRTGKTRKAMESGGHLHDASDDWWCDYKGEDTLILDEFRSGGMKLTRLLRVLDGYKLKLNAKGGHKFARWTKVFITSNVDPKEWYAGCDFRSREALFARINDVIEMSADDE